VTEVLVAEDSAAVAVGVAVEVVVGLEVHVAVHLTTADDRVTGDVRILTVITTTFRGETNAIVAKLPALQAAALPA